MKLFEKRIIRYRNSRNALIFSRFLVSIILLALLVFDLFLTVFFYTADSVDAMFYTAFGLKIVLLVFFLFQIFQLIRSFIDKYRSAREMDLANRDKTDTYQNALELQNSGFDKNILQKVVSRAEKKAEKQKIKSDLSILKPIYVPFLLVLFGNIILYLFAAENYQRTYEFFLSNTKPEIRHKDFVELIPGNVSIVSNSDLIIEVIEPEPDIEHILFYKQKDNWRETVLVQNRKKFENLDFSFDYFVKTPFAVSDTFRIDVFELPAIRTLSLKYDYPSYTGMKTISEKKSAGFIKALVNTKVILTIEANNPLEKAEMIFASGRISNMKRLGKSRFETSFTINGDDSYHINITDFLDNKSSSLEKKIDAAADRFPEIEIVKPGVDTVLNQNMKLPLRIFAADDFGLKNLLLKYQVNYVEADTVVIRENFREKLGNIDYVFNLGFLSLIPGDKITYWTEVTDNSPQNQTSVSQRFVARFPSIEEIYQEIEKEEQQKTDMMRDILEKSTKMQKDFEEKRREMMKKEEVDWEDKKKVEKFLEKQEDLNKDISQIADDYRNLIEKMEQNEALSNETLQKMEKIQELMEDISSEELQETIRKLQEKLEDITSEDMKKAMKDFKFSIEDFSKKLDQTIKLLEDIKKEQSLQKALEISEEMEEMQENLNSKTEDDSADNQQLAEEQQKIGDKLQNLEEQLRKTSEMLDEKDDEELKKALEEMLEQMAEDSLSKDLQQAAQQLQNNDRQQAGKKQEQASSKMSKMTQSLQEMMQMMSSGMQAEIGEIIAQTIRRLLIFSEKHEVSSRKFRHDPFEILDDQINNFEGMEIALKELYKTPMIFLMLNPKMIYDANFTMNTYRELFQYINDAKKAKVDDYLSDIQKGLNLMVFDLMQSRNSQNQGGGGG